MKLDTFNTWYVNKLGKIGTTASFQLPLANGPLDCNKYHCKEMQLQPFYWDQQLIYQNILMAGQL